MLKKLLVAGAGFTALFAGAATIAAPAQDRPGTVSDRPGVITQGRVLIENRTRAEAIPVAIMGDAVVAARLVRQTWEYMSTIVRDNDFQTPLSKLGADGWEAVAIQPLPPAENAPEIPLASVLLKRPRQFSAGPIP